MFLSHINDYTDDLKLNCFEFFYWFSRFEFALKENTYIKRGPYRAALPDWDRFVIDHSGTYAASADAIELLAAPPQRQIFHKGACTWEATNLTRVNTDLGRVVLILKVIRNNLFHGGKHSQKDWDNPERNIFLLTRGKAALDSLSKMGGLQSDYDRLY